MSGNKRILVVDDSATMRMLISVMIGKTFGSRISVYEANNGADALEILLAGRFDMVFTDMNMPEMDGAQLIRNISASLDYNVPITIITTKGEEQDRDYGLSLGANGYITKPLIWSELKEVVNKFLRNEG